MNHSKEMLTFLEERELKLSDMESLLESATDDNGEKRSLSDSEQTRFNDLEAAIKDLDKKIEDQKRRDEIQARIARQRRAKKSTGTPEQKAAQQYSLVRAIRKQLTGNLDGIEKEMHEEARKEARNIGGGIQGFGIPSFLVQPKTRTTLTVGTAATAGNLVDTELRGVIPVLAPELVAEAMGATMLTGLTSDVDFVRQNAYASATWEGENDANAESNLTTNKLQMSPNRLGLKTLISKQLIVQDNFGVENLVRADLNRAIGIAVDTAAFNGSGSGEPEGILNNGSIGSVALGANGAAPTFASLVDLETEVAVDNANMGTLAYLTTPGVRGKLKQTILDSGSGQFIWGQGASELNSYPAFVSNNLPTNLTKGTGTSLHPIIYGDWSSLIIASFGGGVVDIVVDPYTSAGTNIVNLYANSYWDIGLRHPESFAAITDADIS